MTSETTTEDAAEPQWLEDFTQDGAPAGTMACKKCGVLVGRTGTVRDMLDKLVREDFLVLVSGMALREFMASRGCFGKISMATSYYQRLDDYRRMRARARQGVAVPQQSAAELFRRRWTCFLEQPGWRGGTRCTEEAGHATDQSDRGRCGWQWIADPVWDDEAARYGIGVGQASA